MNEQTAKTKWCPWRQGGTTQPKGHYEPGMGHGLFQTIIEPNCIGSACMMWRSDGHVPTGGDVVRQDGDFRWIEPATQPTGYCGLAGKS